MVISSTKVDSFRPSFSKSSISHRPKLNMEKAPINDDGKAADSIIEHVAPKVEQARIAADEEHNLSVWEAITQNKVVVFWCVFFAFSGVAW